MMNNELYRTLRAMENYGGGFAAAIAAAASIADSNNLQRLQDAFPELFAKYREFAALAAANESAA